LITRNNKNKGAERKD